MLENHPQFGKDVKRNHLEWFKEGNRYGARWSKTGEVAIPAIYGSTPYFNGKGLAIVWKDYKAAEGLSKKKERERLIEQEYKEADSHVWNIIAAMGNGMREDGVALCFYHTAWDGDDKWNYKDLIMDDGQTWDEGIRYPAYQDVYFTYPFHNLFFEAYNYSFEDLCNINDFRVNVRVKLETKEQDKISFRQGKSE